jgi:hypothetical protein
LESMLEEELSPFVQVVKMRLETSRSTNRF